LMMAQMFGQAQGSQLQLIREELGRLHQVTQDLRGLQAESSARPPAAPQPAAPPREVAPPEAAAPAPPGAAAHAPTPRPAAAPAQDDAHALIYERIEELQRERQSRWQTILQFLAGRHPG